MASLIYDALAQDLIKGNHHFDTDTYKVMLVTSTYAPNKGTDAKRSDVTNEVVGTGYTAGGLAATTTLALDTTNHAESVTFGNVSWPNATITARGAVIYKSTGTASADPIVAYVDFGADVSSTAAAFAVTFSSPLKLQN